VFDLDEAGAEAVAKGLPYGGIGLRCDITDPGSVAAAVAAVVERFGRIDVLVNNAGLLRVTDVLDVTAEEWATVIGVNLTGPFTVTQAVGRVMRGAGYGRITFVSSLAALGNPGNAHYSAAKAGVAGLARTVALELGPFGVTSNVVAPAVVRGVRGGRGGPDGGGARGATGGHRGRGGVLLAAGERLRDGPDALRDGQPHLIAAAPTSALMCAHHDRDRSHGVRAEST